MATRTLTEADDRRDVVLHPGDTAVVRLTETPATGHQWTATVHGSCVVPEDAGFAPPGAAPPGSAAPGAAGTRSFRLRAAAPGMCDVEFRLGRVWETGRSPERSVLLHVLVR